MKVFKILHIANRGERYAGNRFYSYPYKMNNGFVRNGHCVYWFSDRDIARSLSVIPSRKLGTSRCNKKILEVCDNFRPDIVVFGHSDVLRNETIEEIKKKHKSFIVQYNFDLLHDKNIKKLKDRNGYVDFNFITTGGKFLGELAGKGSRYAYMPNPVDMSIDCHANYKNNNLDIDVFFAGQTSDMVGVTDLRTQITSLPGEMPDITFGMYNGVWGHRYLELLGRAKMGLSISVGLKDPGVDGCRQYLYSSDRIGQYLGNGLLTFVEKKFRLADVYGSDCLVEVENYSDLKEKIRFFAKKDGLRIRMAEISHRLAHEQFNERLVAQYLIETTIDSKFSHSYRWPTQVWG